MGTLRSSYIWMHAPFIRQQRSPARARSAWAATLGMGLLAIQVSASVATAQDRTQDNNELCQRAGKAFVHGFEKENPDKPGYMSLRDVKLAFTTIDGVICQAWMDFTDPKIESRNMTFPVRPTDDGKIRLCNRQGKCTEPMDY